MRRFDWCLTLTFNDEDVSRSFHPTRTAALACLQCEIGDQDADRILTHATVRSVNRGGSLSRFAFDTYMPETGLVSF